MRLDLHFLPRWARRKEPAPERTPPTPAQDTQSHLSLLSSAVSGFESTLAAPPANQADTPAVALQPSVVVRHAALLVGIDPLHALVLARKLQACGFDVETADTEGGACDAFRRSSFGVVLIDCDSPGIDGFAVGAALRGLEGDAGYTPLIAVTAETSSTNRARRKAAGFDNYLERPVRQDKLNVILERYLPASIAGVQADFVDIDKAELARLCGLGADGAGFLRHFVNVFLSSAQVLINKMRSAAEDKNAPRLAQHARTLKALACEVGAMRMQEICGTVHALASSATVTGMTARLTELSLAFERVSGDLRGAEAEFLREIAGGPDARAARPSAGASNQPRRASRILVAEGNPVLARFLTTALSAAGHEVYQAPNGRDALQLFRERAMDLAILDANMPEGNGFFVLGEIRTDPRLKNMPVMILSERSREQEVLRAFEAGADDYVPKPFSPLEVTARVRSLLRRG